LKGHNFVRTCPNGTIEKFVNIYLLRRYKKWAHMWDLEL